MATRTPTLLSVDAGYPFTGIDSSSPTTNLGSRSPSAENILFEDDVLRSRYGYSTHGTVWDNNEILSVFEHTDVDSNRYLFCVTVDNIFKWDSDNGEWTIVTKTISRDGTQANELPVCDCEDASVWVANADASYATSTTRKVGLKSAAITIDAAFGTGEAAYYNTGASDLSDATTLGFWIQSDITLEAGDLEIHLCDAVEGGGTSDDFVVPALSAGEWKYCIVEGSMQADIASITLEVISDEGACVILLDDIRALKLLTGDADSHIETVDTFDGDDKKLVLVNGSDLPLVWDTSQFGFLDLLVPAVDFADLTTVRHLAWFYSRIVFGNYVTTAEFPQSIAWTAAGTIIDFDTVPGAGQSNLANLSGDIYRLVPLGNRLIVYSRYSIAMLSYVGGNYTFGFDLRVGAIRMASSASIVDLGPYHVFQAEDNFYLYDGSSAVVPIGDSIAKEYRSIVNSAKIGRSFAFDDRTNQRLYFCIPTTTDYPDTVYLLHYELTDMSRSRWSKLTFNDAISAMGQWSRMNVLTWNALKTRGDTWVSMKEAGTTWGGSASSEDFPTLVFGDTIGNTYEQDDSVVDDTNVAVSSEWSSRDFVVPQEYLSRYGRWQEVEFEAKGSSVKLEYSTDEGSTWTTVGTQTLSTGWTSYILYLDVYSEKLRIRLSNSTLSKSFHLRWLRAWFVLGGSR